MLRLTSELEGFLQQNAPDTANPYALTTQPASSGDLTVPAADAELGLHSFLNLNGLSGGIRTAEDQASLFRIPNDTDMSQQAFTTTITQ